MTLSLRLRIVLVQLAAVALVLGFMGAVLIPRLEREALADRLLELDSLAKVIAHNAEPAMLFLDERAAAEAAAAARVDPEVRRVVVYDAAGERFAIAPAEAEAPARLPFDAAPGTLRVQAPIGRPGEWVGAVVLEVGTESIQQQSQSIRKTAVSAALIGLALAVFFAWALEGLVSRRILALSRAIGQSHSNPETIVRVPVDGGEGDEVTELALRVNELLDAIELREAQLIASRERLELRVADRTRELEQTTSRTTAIVQSLMDGLIVVDPEHRVLIANEAMRRMLGADPQGEPIRSFLEPVEGDVDERLDRDVGKVRQWTLIREGRAPLPVEVSIALIAGEDNLQTVLSVRDISERLRLDQLKADFVSTVSHELRTPITAVYGSLRLVLGGVTGPVAEPTQGMLERAFDNSQRLIRLVNDLLDMQRVERGQLVITPEPVRLDRLVHSAVDASEGYDARAIPIAVDAPDEPVWVEADGDRIVQVLHNFLSNALKYSPDDGTVRVRIEADEARVRVAVRDEGPGIPPEFHARMFGAFQQADSGPERRKPGTGLGLAVSKAIIDGHGGSIGFASPPGEGATLWFELARLSRESASERGGPAA